MLQSIDVPADSKAIALQETMLSAKRSGVIILPPIGVFTWREFIILTDILLSGVWKRTTMDEGSQLTDLYQHRAGPTYPYDNRHDSLRFLSWLLTGWPLSDGAEVAQEMVRRWLRCETEYSGFHLPFEWVGKNTEDRKIEPAIRDRYEQLCAGLEQTDQYKRLLDISGSSNPTGYTRSARLGKSQTQS